MADDYREAHGLSTGTRLVGERTRAKLAEVWARHEPEHLARLDAARDPHAARAQNRRESQWRPERVAQRIESGRRQTHPLTPKQIATLGDITDMQGWADRARALIKRDGVSQHAIAQAVGISQATVSQRLRRYPAAPQVHPVWQRSYNLLRDHLAEHGTYPTKPHRTALWASIQRHLHRRGQLDRARAALLEALPGWRWEIPRPTRSDRLPEFEAWVADHGRIPAQTDHLGDWVHDVRRAYHRGGLAPDLEAALEAIPGWSWRPSAKDRGQTAAWWDGYEDLRAYASEHGHAAPTRREMWNGRRLGHWVATQRNTRDTLSPEAIAALEALPGWAWRLHGDTKMPARSRRNTGRADQRSPTSSKPLVS